MDIYWHQLMWDGRWMALKMLWNAVVVKVATHWWFGPLVVVILISADWKEILRFGANIAQAFGHTHGGVKPTTCSVARIPALGAARSSRGTEPSSPHTPRRLGCSGLQASSAKVRCSSID